MNKRGFTLIELIATIGILGLTVGIIMVNMQGLESKQSTSSYEDNISSFTETACGYVDSLSFKPSNKDATGCDDRECCKAKSISGGIGCIVSLKTIIENGIIDEESEIDEDGTKYKDYKNKMYVTVSWNADGTVNGSTVYKKTCTCKKTLEDGTVTDC